MSGVRARLRLGAYLNVGDDEGVTALMHACAEGHAGVVAVLLKAGCSNHTDVRCSILNRTALHYSCAGGHVRCAERMIEEGDACLNLGKLGNKMNGPSHITCPCIRMYIPVPT